jgi:peptidoglycan/xylan/chitin deacetylase (PgdA/CDA1 family)
MRFKPPKFLRKLMPELVWDTPEVRDVFITFDDGPTPGVTEWILDELARRDAKATFFCLGRNVEMYPELYRRILAEGHRVGNHTYGHLKGWGTDVERYVADVDRASGRIGSSLFRPPYGRISPVQARALGRRYKIVMWNIISRDYNRRLTPRACLDNVVRHVRAGDIVVFHDSEKAFRNMSYALPRTLDHLSARGMKSKAIEL